ncbi:unnamed protein product [Arctogadus glacialis]
MNCSPASGEYRCRVCLIKRAKSITDPSALPSPHSQQNAERERGQCGPREREVWGPLLELLPPRPDPG